MRVLTIILGILMVVGGIYCVLTPITTYSTIGWLIGAAMLVEGIASAITWGERRRLGMADGFSLVAAIVSILLGVFLLGSYVLRFAVDAFIAYMIAIWLVVAGIARIAVAIRMRSSQDQMGSSGWVLQIVLGVLIVILGILCIFNPLAVMAGVGMMLGISIVFVGVDLLVGGFLI